MIRTTKDVLSEKKGIADALGIMMLAMAMLVAVGVVVGNFAILSKQASQLQILSQEITNRAELYAGSLNNDLVSPQLPAMTRACSSTPAVCTEIISTVASSGKKVLRIRADAISGISSTITKDVTLVFKEVTHVTEVDKNGENVWALSSEGLRYQIWGVTNGEPTIVDPSDMGGFKDGAGWVSVADRAGIDSAGALWVWGENTIGQAGIGSSSPTPVTPRKVASAASFRSVVTDDTRGYAIDSKGSVWVWGKNDLGQLGLGHNKAVMNPTKITSARMMSIAVGKNNTFMLGMDGSLYVVGASQAGFPANSGFSAQVLNPGTKYMAIAASSAGAVAMIDSKGVLSMKGNTYSFTPGATKFSSVSLGSTTGYAISSAGELYSWGTGSTGQLGLGSTTTATTPTKVKPGTKFVTVEGGKTSAFAIDTAGRLYYFGKTPSGSVTGKALPQVSVPTILMNESRFREVVAESGDTAVALLDADGNVYGMGTQAPGLWPINYLGANDQPIRMPAPDGFAPIKWG